MHCKKEIVVNDEKGKTLVKPMPTGVIEQKIVFSFSFFKGKSIKLKDFNNCYENENDAKKSVSDFFATVSEISKMNSTSFYSQEMKQQLHYNQFCNNEHINMIEKILIEGYGMTKAKVDQFERLYFEFSFSNGKRVISTILCNNVFEILFIDSNHMVCKESCRNLKRKLMYEIPGIFDYTNNIEKFREYDKITLFEMLLEDAKKGLYSSLEDLIADFEDFKIDF